MKTLPSACLRPILTIFWNRPHKKSQSTARCPFSKIAKNGKSFHPTVHEVQISAVNASGETQHRWSQQMRKNVDKSMWRWWIFYYFFIIFLLGFIILFIQYYIHCDLPPLRPQCGEAPGRDSNPGRAAQKQEHYSLTTTPPWNCWAWKVEVGKALPPSNYQGLKQWCNCPVTK